MTIYLVCIEYSSEPTIILGASLNIEHARKIAADYASTNSVGETVIYAMEDGKDYDWELPEKVPLKV